MWNIKFLWIRDNIDKVTQSIKNNIMMLFILVYGWTVYILLHIDSVLSTLPKELLVFLAITALIVIIVSFLIMFVVILKFCGSALIHTIGWAMG